MQKYRNAEIKSFEFTDLQGTHVITQTQFKSFEFGTLDGKPMVSEIISDETIRTERNFAKKNNFKIDDIVQDCRGLTKQEQNDLEERIQSEVKKRLELAFQEAYQEGLEKGRAEGRELAINEYQETLAQKAERFDDIITQVQGQSDKILQKNRQEVYEFIKRFTKWIILKEIDEKVYLESLLEKLILELNVRKNLIVKVGRANFEQMPEVIHTVESKLGQLVNVRVEIVPEIHHPGIILESENGLIDGSMEGVFSNIDKIFEQVIRHE